jgi:hypothetical protein
MATNYNIDKTKNGVNGFGLPFCDTIYSATLTASTNTTIAVPLTSATGAPTATTYNKFMAVFSYSSGATVFVALNKTAAVPVGATFAATTSEINPTAKMVKSTDTINVISSGTPSVTIAFYAIQE